MLTAAAEKVTPEIVNFMAKHGRGLICLALTPERAEQLRLLTNQLKKLVGLRGYGISVVEQVPFDSTADLPFEEYSSIPRRGER
jgi:3,4-dihydroxy-2-butanone 4-phosphate synthase